MLKVILVGSMFLACSGLCPFPSPQSESTSWSVRRTVAFGEPPAANDIPKVEAPVIERFSEPGLRDVVVTLSAEGTLAELGVEIGKGAKCQAFVDWERLETAGVYRDQRIGFPLLGVGLEKALAIVNERLAVATGMSRPIAVRRTGDLVELSLLEVFDRREKKTVMYDVRPFVDGLESEEAAVEVREICDAMQQTIESEGWRDNGGEMASSCLLEWRLLVTAPPRYHVAISWMLSQVNDPPEEGDGKMKKTSFQRTGLSEASR